MILHVLDLLERSRFRSVHELVSCTFRTWVLGASESCRKRRSGVCKPSTRKLGPRGACVASGSTHFLRYELSRGRLQVPSRFPKDRKDSRPGTTGRAVPTGQGNVRCLRQISNESAASRASRGSRLSVGSRPSQNSRRSDSQLG